VDPQQQRNVNIKEQWVHINFPVSSLTFAETFVKDWLKSVMSIDFCMVYLLFFKRRALQCGLLFSPHSLPSCTSSFLSVHWLKADSFFDVVAIHVAS